MLEKEKSFPFYMREDRVYSDTKERRETMDHFVVCAKKEGSNPSKFLLKR